MGGEKCINILGYKSLYSIPRKKCLHKHTDNIKINLIQIGLHCLQAFRPAQHRDMCRALVSRLTGCGLDRHLNDYQLFKLDSSPRSCKFIRITAQTIRPIMNDELIRIRKETSMASL